MLWYDRGTPNGLPSCLYLLVPRGAQENEGHDREQIALPGVQEQLLLAVSEAARGAMIVVLMCGGPVDVAAAARDNPKVDAILWVGYGGQVRT